MKKNFDNEFEVFGESKEQLDYALFKKDQKSTTKHDHEVKQKIEDKLDSLYLQALALGDFYGLGE